MSTTTIPYRFVVKRDTAANFTAANTLLKSGEWALETDTRKLKIGDGTTAWGSLPYAVPAILHGATSKTTPVDADEIPLIDSAASNGLKKLTWLNLKARLKAYFDTIYASSSSGAWSTVKKSADESRISTTTLADDSALSFACAAGATYRVRVRVLFNQANTTMNFKFQNSFSAASTEIVTVRKQINVASSISSSNLFTVASLGIINTPVTQSAAIAGYGAVEYDLVFVATAAGTFSFKWAQGTSSAANLTVLRGSYLDYMAL